MLKSGRQLDLKNFYFLDPVDQKNKTYVSDGKKKKLESKSTQGKLLKANRSTEHLPPSCVDVACIQVDEVSVPAPNHLQAVAGVTAKQAVHLWLQTLSLLAFERQNNFYYPSCKPTLMEQFTLITSNWSYVKFIMYITWKIKRQMAAYERLKYLESHYHIFTLELFSVWSDTHPNWLRWASIHLIKIPLEFHTYVQMTFFIYMY